MGRQPFRRRKADNTIDDGTSAGGASAIGGLDDVLMDATNFTNGFLLQLNSDGSAPTTGTLNSATGNVGLGEDVLANLTSADYNIAIGNQSLNDITTGGYNIAIGGWGALQKITTQSNNIGIGSGAGQNITNGAGNICIGGNASKGNSSGVASSYNVAIGDNAMYAINGVANNNVAIGKYAMRDGLTTGDDNVAIGESAGRNISTASNLVFIGKEAGHNNTTGLRNIAIGYKAYDNADTESDNIAIGYDALGGSIAGGEQNLAIGNYAGDAITSGDGNVALGHKAGSGITTGYKNVYVGWEAGESTTSAGENVGIGDLALNDNTTGGGNVAVGHQTLKSTTDGYVNVAVGQDVGMFITTGQRNTGVGGNALRAATTGHYNIALGQYAGDNITTGTGNVVIGRADVPSATANRQLSISAGDSTTPVWITGESDGSVNIPNSILKINGSVGSDGQVLTSTGSAVAWEDAGGGSSHFDGAKLIDIPQSYLNQLYPFGDAQMAYGNPFTSYVQYFPFLAPDSGNITKLGIRVHNYAGDADVQIGIYSDSNGSPASKLGRVEISIDSAAAFDSTQFDSTITLVKGTQYWVGYMVDDSSVNNSLYGSNTSNRAITYSGQAGGNQASRVNVRSNNNATSLPSSPSSISGYWAYMIPQVYCVIG